MSISKLKKDSISYLKESKKYIYSSAAAFAFFIAVGYIIAGQLGFLDEVLKELVKDVSQLEGFDIALYIFANNVQSAIIGMVMGVFLGIVPIINIVANGVVIGYVLSQVVEMHGFAQTLMILPHGIFELPAIFIALGLGIKLGASFFSDRPLKKLKQRLYSSAAVLLTIILPLLALAALIEGMLIALFS